MRLLSPVLFGLMIFPAGVFAQNQGTIVELPANWRSGEKYQLELVKEREQYQGESIQRSNGSRTPIDVEVLRKLEVGYVIRWTYGKTELRGSAAGNDPLLAEMISLAENLRLDLRTDAFGSVVGLENKDEIISHYRLATDQLLQSLEGKGLPRETLDQIRAGIAPLANPATVEVLAVKEPSVFYAASGGSYRLGTPQTYEHHIANHLGGRPFPGKGHFLLLEVKPEGERAVIEWRQSIDPDEATAIMRESMTAMLQRMGRPPPSEQDLPSIQIEDLALYLFDTKTGWPLSVSHERNIVIGPVRRVDRLIFRVIAGE